MDLQEGKKKGNVWKLECEAFKKPIEIKIWFENKELAEFNARCERLEWELKKYENALVEHWKEIWWLNVGVQRINKRIEDEHEQLLKVADNERETNSDLNQLYKAIADAKNTIELQNWTILKLQEQMKELEKKITKQPRVFHDKCFISWRENAWLWMYELPDWDYLMTLNIKIWEHNEYVENKDGLIVEKIHVEDNYYVPFYKLEWGTELDTPTATIYYDLIFMPI